MGVSGFLGRQNALIADFSTLQTAASDIPGSPITRSIDSSSTAIGLGFLITGARGKPFCIKCGQAAGIALGPKRPVKAITTSRCQRARNSVSNSGKLGGRCQCGDFVHFRLRL